MTSRKFINFLVNHREMLKFKNTQFHMDLAASIQVVTEEIIIKLAKTLKKETGIKKIFVFVRRSCT